MVFSFENLDEVTRRYMREEIDVDVANQNMYISPRLSDAGKQEYPDLLREAVEKHDENWLSQQLRKRSLLNRTETRKTKDKTIEVKVPETAAETLSEGEFNRYYMRALCCRALAERIANVVVYRAKDVTSARSESMALLNSLFSPEALLKDLRTHPGVDTALGLPPGPNSGLSIKLPG